MAPDGFADNSRMYPLSLQFFIKQQRLEGAKPSDAAFAFGCMTGDKEALSRFESELIPLARGAIRRFERNEATVDELCQQLRVKLLTGTPMGLTAWRGKGPLANWIRVVAMRLTIDALRKRQPAEHAGPFWEDQVATDATERSLIQQRYGEAFECAFRLALSSLNKKERAVLKLHALERQNIDSIATVYGVHRATAARWLEAIRRGLRDRTFTALRLSVSLNKAEVSTVVRALISQVDFSLSHFLASSVS
jgi:RNA polymerase sigma-70 factor, ECF subfamily